MKTFFGRQIIMTTLDPVPRLLRTVPGHFVLNDREVDAIKNNDGDVWKELADIAMAETRAEALGVYRRRK